MELSALEKGDELITRAFYAYLKITLQRSARHYINSENSNKTDTVFLEDVYIVPDSYYQGNAEHVVCARHNYHIHIQNELLAEHIPALDDIDRDIIFLLFYEEMTTIEAAEVLGISQQAVCKRKNKLLGRLKCALT